MIGLDKKLAWCNGEEGCECMRCRVRLLTKKGVRKNKAIIMVASQLGIDELLAKRYILFVSTIGKHRKHDSTKQS